MVFQTCGPDSRETPSPLCPSGPTPCSQVDFVGIPGQAWLHAVRGCGLTVERVMLLLRTWHDNVGFPLQLGKNMCSLLAAASPLICPWYHTVNQSGCRSWSRRRSCVAFLPTPPPWKAAPGPAAARGLRTGVLTPIHLDSRTARWPVNGPLEALAQLPWAPEAEVSRHLPAFISGAAFSKGPWCHSCLCG